jgi:hypothetical protein
MVHEDALEPILAHGARMSWAGLLRPGDEFPTTHRSRRATVTAARGAPLRRFFGGWSVKYRRFTSNLSSPALQVTVTEPRAPPSAGIEAIVHWVSRADLLRSGPGSVAQGDGWPTELWDSFLASRERLGRGSVGEQLRAFAETSSANDAPLVTEWRRLLRGEPAAGRAEEDPLRGGWLPVPASLDAPFGPRVCLVSWSPSPLRFDSLTTALGSAFAEREAADVENQARYYLECRLAARHGIRFSADDALIDRAFEAGPSVRRLRGEWTALEDERIGDPRYGRLDRRGGDPVSDRPGR